MMQQEDIKEEIDEIDCLQDIETYDEFAIYYKQELKTDGELKYSSESESVSSKASLRPSVSYNNKNSKKARTIRQKDFCVYCKTLVLNFARHLKRNHHSEIEVKKIFSLPVNAKSRKNRINLLRKKGNFLVSTKPVKKSNAVNLLPCVHCLGYYSGKYLWKHKKMCTKNPSNSNLRPQVEAQNYLVKNLKIDQQLREKIFPRMLPDKVSLVAKKDSLICAFGAHYMKTHREKHYVKMTSRKMRELAKILIEMKKLNPYILNLLYALQPKYYNSFITSAKIIAEYDSVKNSYKSPTFVVNIGTSLKQCCDIAIEYASEKKDIYAYQPSAETENNLKTLSRLLQINWKYDISNPSADDHIITQTNKLKIISHVTDLKLLDEYLTSKTTKVVTKLERDNLDQKAYVDLTDIIYCRMTLLNRKKPEELQYMLLKFYEKSEYIQNSNDFSDVVSVTENNLMTKCKRVFIEGKPILFSNDIQESIQILLKYRKLHINPTNPYLFAKSNTNNICGYNVFKKYVSACRSKNSDIIASTRLRKRLATMTQILNMSDDDFERLVDFMRHTSDVHKGSYEVHQTSKISKPLGLTEKGVAEMFKDKLTEKGVAEMFKDKSFDNIDMNLSEELSGSVEDNNDLLPTEKDARLLSVLSTDETENEIINTKIPDVRKGPKRTLVPWTNEQKRIINEYFKVHIEQKKAPKRNECEKVLEKYPDILNNRTWLKIKVYVQNVYTCKVKYIK